MNNKFNIEETILSELQPGSSGPDHDPDFDPEVTVADPAAATRRRTRAGATTRTRAGIQNSFLVEFVVFQHVQIAYKIFIMSKNLENSYNCLNPPTGRRTRRRTENISTL